MATENIKYVDSVNGSDLNDGSSLSPYETIDKALLSYNPGSIIALYSGNYPAVSVSDTRLKIVALPDSSPVVDSISVTNGQGTFIGLEVTNGISAVNPDRYGALNINKCVIPSGDAITTDNVEYVSIHRNRIETASEGISITGASEAAIGSNLITGTTTPVIVDSVDRADLYLNTIDDATSIDVTPGTSLTNNYDVTYIYITPAIIASKTIPLPISNIYSVAINVVNGSSINNGLDFSVVGNLISWDGLGLDGVLAEGDMLRIIYTSQKLNKIRVDSNNITNVSSNVSLTSDFSHNNFYNTPTSGPLGDNISADPLYDVEYGLNAGSPSIDSANPTLWDNTFLEVAPLNRNIDFDGAHRFYAQDDLGEDIGSKERLNNSFTGSEYFVDESGFNVVNDGDISDPLLSVSTAFSTGNNPINIILKDKPDSSNKRKTTIVESSLDLSNSELTVHEPQVVENPHVDKIDVAYIRSFLGEIPTGTSAYVSELGDDGTADGTLSLPYRTIEAALASPATVILVLPGPYTLFTGVSGKKIIFLEDVRSDQFSAFANSNVSNLAWYTSLYGGQVSYVGKKVNFTHPALPTKVGLISRYAFNNAIDYSDDSTLDGNIGIKVKGNIGFENSTSTMLFKVSNVATNPSAPTGGGHSVFIEFSPDYIKLGGETYDNSQSKVNSFASKFDQPAEEGWFDFTIRDDQVEASFRSENYTREIKFTLNDNGGDPNFSYRNGWFIDVESSGELGTETDTYIENLHVRADGTNTSVQGFATEYHTLDPIDLLNGYITLTNIPIGNSIGVSLTEGTSQYFGIDYTILDTFKLSWSGLGMESLPLSIGDTIRIVYYGSDSPIGVPNIHKVGRTTSGLRYDNG
jgi:hypothetical protein